MQIQFFLKRMKERLIDCLTSTLAIFQLHCGVKEREDEMCKND